MRYAPNATPAEARRCGGDKDKTGSWWRGGHEVDDGGVSGPKMAREDMTVNDQVNQAFASVIICRRHLHGT